MSTRKIFNQERADYILINAQIIYQVDLFGDKNNRYSVWCRSAISKIMKEEGFKIKMISNFLNKDHSTILYGLGKHEDNLQFDKEYKLLFDEFVLIIGDSQKNRDYLLNNFFSKIYHSTVELKENGFDVEFIEDYIQDCFQQTKLKIA